MLQSRIRSIPMPLFFMLITSLITGCFGTEYQPATIEFVSPGNGTVISPDLEQIRITGIVTPGTSDIMRVRMVNPDGTYQALALNEDNLFTGLFPVEADGKFATCTIEVMDTSLKTNMERISFPVGDALEIGSAQASANALLGLSLTEQFLGEATPMMESVVNTMLPGVIETMLPLSVDLQDVTGLNLGDIVVDPETASNSCLFNSNCGQTGAVVIGDISMEIFIEPDNTIGASMIITPLDTSDGNAVFVRGYHSVGLLKTHLQLSTDRAEVNDIKLQLGIDMENQIVATAILDEITLNLGDTDLEYGEIGATLPYWLLNAMVSLLTPVFQGLELDGISILDADDLMLKDIMGMNITPSFPSDPIVTTSAAGDAMRIDLGLAMSLTDWDNTALNPDVTGFYATPDDVMPDTMANPETGLEDIAMVVSDDLVNQALFVVIQSGMLADLDLTSVITSTLPVIAANSPDLEVTASVEAAPIADFSGDFEIISDDGGNVVTFGKFALSNLVVEIKNLQLAASGEPHTMRLSLDMETVLGIGLNEDMTKIEAKANVDLDDISMTVLYTSDAGTAILNAAMDIGLNLGRSIIQSLIPVALSVDIPDLGLDELGIEELPDITFTESSFENNSLIVKLDVQF